MLAAWVALTHMPRCSDCAGRDCAVVWCACTEGADKYAYMHARCYYSSVCCIVAMPRHFAQRS